MTRRPISPSSANAFTVVELLVAIAVLAIVSVGLSVIFGTVGDTVTDGRRVSELNRTAARIESQLRDDLDMLTRDGFMVIANRYASDPTGSPLVEVRLSPRDTAGRPRRADELLFFARGDFQTRRLPVAPGIVARSSEAAIYFGIGQRRPFDFSNPDASAYFNPAPWDANFVPFQSAPPNYSAMIGVAEPPGQIPNPNRYARDWTLLRQATLLAEPSVVSVLPSDVFGIRRDTIQGRNILLDSARQIALQPAARSVFNSLTWTDRNTFGVPGSVPADGQSRWWIGDSNPSLSNYGTAFPVNDPRPAWRSSGVVDIAQGDILTVRRQLEALSVFGPPSSYKAPFTLPNENAPFPVTADGFKVDWNDHAQAPRPVDARNFNLNTVAHRNNARAWALDMMPSLWNGESSPPEYLAGVRYEPLPTRLIDDGTRFPATDAGRRARAVAEANQEMLSAQVFVPRCTEFIVEWSYGYVNDFVNQNDPRFKQLIWYGLPRADRDTNGDGRIDLNDHADTNFRVVDRYEFRAPISGTPQRPDPPREALAMPTVADYLTDPEVAVFGLTSTADMTVTNASPSPVIPWPRLIRITMTLADPDDDSIERTYQFVFGVPGEQG